MFNIVTSDCCKEQGKRHLKKPTWPHEEQLELSFCLSEEKGAYNEEETEKKGANLWEHCQEYQVGELWDANNKGPAWAVSVQSERNDKQGVQPPASVRWLSVADREGISILCSISVLPLTFLLKRMAFLLEVLKQTWLKGTWVQECKEGTEPLASPN